MGPLMGAKRFFTHHKLAPSAELKIRRTWPFRGVMRECVTITGRRQHALHNSQAAWRMFLQKHGVKAFTRMRRRVDIRHPLLYTWRLWHNRARTLQLVKRESRRGLLDKIGAFFVRARAFLKKRPGSSGHLFAKTPQVE